MAYTQIGTATGQTMSFELTTVDPAVRYYFNKGDKGKMFPGTVAIGELDTGKEVIVKPTGDRSVIIQADVGVKLNRAMAKALIEAINRGVEWQKPTQTTQE